MPIFLGNNSDDFPINNMTKIGSNGLVFDFSIDYNAINTRFITNARKYWMTKFNAKWLDG